VTEVTRPARVAATVWILVLLAASARGQPEAGAIASGSVAAAVLDRGTNASGTSVSVAGALGYRFNRVIGLGVEVTWIPSLKPVLPSSGPSPYTSVVFSDPGGDALFFTTNVRIEIPTTSRRVIPFAVGGGGVASTTQRYTVTVSPVLPPIPVVPPIPVGGLVTVPPLPPFILPPIQSRPVTTSTGLALTLGGGVSLLATDHLSIDVDLRSLYIRGNNTGSIGRFGVGASYRF
jgi:opacity protein-like surface antigen